ncbi:hypothetical protein [Atribacter laminatus]|nr:hypothetical protein [Atribacter laminatus]
MKISKRFLGNSFKATNLNLILGFHPYPHLLPSREKKLLVVIGDLVF